ncbi:hypothetical protein ES708_21444 [subsurface metagenome]
MKVKIKDLRPNPYRNLESCPVDKERVNNLVKSINETGFWSNILARERGGKFEVAYGHHRLVALKKVFKHNDEVDIPVKELDDVKMLKIMATENHEHWGLIPSVRCDAVREAKKFLEDSANKDVLSNLPGVTERLRSKNYPIGAKIIADFLGDNYSEFSVWETLKIIRLIDKKELDKEVADSMPSMNSINNFLEANKVVNVSLEHQRLASKEIRRIGNLNLNSMKETLNDARIGLLIEKRYLRVKVKDLMPNPLINPILERAVEKCIDYIKEVWFNRFFVGREKDGKYEIAVGMHWLEALRQLCELKKLSWNMDVHLHCMKISDGDMIRIYANKACPIDWEKIDDEESYWEEQNNRYYKVRGRR